MEVLFQNTSEAEVGMMVLKSAESIGICPARSTTAVDANRQEYERSVDGVPSSSKGVLV